MDVRILEDAKRLSSKVILEAGKIAKNRFDEFTFLEEKDIFGDVITEVDLLAEELILKEINRVFPEHKIHSEEAGDNGQESEWLWLVDPLDGTNNFAIGLPVFSSSITLMYKKEPVLGVIFEPMINRLFISCIHEGAFCNDKRLQMKKKDTNKRFNLGWIQGHKVQNEEKAVKLRQYIDINCKRMMRLWAPTIQWCMLAKGDLDGIILYNSEGDDLYSGILMVKEAGGIVIDFEGNPFNGMNEEPYLIACHPDNKEYFLSMINKGLSN
ncbi:inositol monophosphatase family protein [Paenibacillus sp. IHBB 10380]|uniref:inositol monophosphatase family protein n=1 Tax=Paenibacillus sp. IHBB 10380 TaxID=1566358 RepID=UPI0005CFA454|nr:inositol monophosphatase family protein [Paenibacillus sp. IHBB 10380]AJS58805.1 inositol phosphatase [Paenibacillus sp. IHBB 10380]